METHLGKERAGRGRSIKNDHINEVFKLMEMSTCHCFRGRGQANISTRVSSLKEYNITATSEEKTIKHTKEMSCSPHPNILCWYKKHT